jgi:hypothetical protein
MAVRNEIPFAYLVQHDQCVNTSLLRHSNSIVLQVAAAATQALQLNRSRAFLFVLCAAHCIPVSLSHFYIIFRTGAMEA